MKNNTPAKMQKEFAFKELQHDITFLLKAIEENNETIELDYFLKAQKKMQLLDKLYEQPDDRKNTKMSGINPERKYLQSLIDGIGQDGN